MIQHALKVPVRNAAFFTHPHEDTRNSCENQHATKKWNRPWSLNSTNTFQWYSDIHKVHRHAEAGRSSVSHQRSFLDFLAKEFNVHSLDDWYRVTKMQLIGSSGGGILKSFGNSPSKMLAAVYPEQQWHFWKFAHSPKSSVRHERKCWDSLICQHNLTDLRALLYHLSTKLGSEFDRKRMDSHWRREFKTRVHAAFPECKWEQQEWRKYFGDGVGTSHGEFHLRQTVKQLFPHESVHYNYRDSDLTNPNSGRPLELDIYLPNLHLAFEYQGKQHYDQVDFYKLSKFSSQQARDSLKSEACQQVGITLLEVPYWWNCSAQSLATTIHQYRPDIKLHDSVIQSITAKVSGYEVIPLVNPLLAKQLDKLKHDPAAAFVQIVNLPNSMSPQGMIMTRLVGGFRAVWNGSGFVLKNTKMLTKQPKLLVPPIWFRQQLPATTFLDGELWCGPGKLDQLYHLLQRDSSITETEWKCIEFVIFDSPDLAIRHKSYMQRHESIVHAVSQQQKQQQQTTNSTNVSIASPVQCLSHQHMTSVLEDTIKQGGKGIVLRDAQQPYTLEHVMWKRQLDFSGLAAVTSVSEQSVRCINVFGIEFPVIRAPDDIKAGAVVTYKFCELSRDRVPLFAVVEKIHHQQRTDISPFAICTATHASHCQSCSRNIAAGQLCIKANVIYNPHTTPHLLPAASCLHKNCFQQLCKGAGGKFLPPNFEGRVAVQQPELQRLEQFQLFKASSKNIEFVASVAGAV